MKFDVRKTKSDFRKGVWSQAFNAPAFGSGANEEGPRDPREGDTDNPPRDPSSMPPPREPDDPAR